MKISFPHMGYSYIGFKHLVEELGFECILPPVPSQKTFTYGVRYSPEFACMPFKVLMGTYVEVLEKGAEVLISSGGIGPCRAGLYGMIHEKILQDAGYDCKMLIIDPPQASIREFYENLALLKTKNMGWGQFLRIIRTAWTKLDSLDKLEMFTAQKRAYEVVKGSTQQALERAVADIDAAKTLKEVKEAEEEGKKLIEAVPKDYTKRPLKVGIVGEIFVVIEPFMNMDIERRLGEMEVITHRSIYITTYVRNLINKKNEAHIIEAARPYLDQLIGGHGINSVGEAVLYGKEGYDGVIQLAPFTCIPEIVARSILPRVTKDYDIPVLTINIDEQTGEQGVQTRLEAFLDLLREKRRVLEECS